MPLVGIVIGSQSDAEVVKATQDALTELGIEHELSVLSAHRTPDKVRQLAGQAPQAEEQHGADGGGNNRGKGVPAITGCD